MNILAISGSAQEESSNLLLLQAIKDTVVHSCSVEIFHSLHTFPLFSPQRLAAGIPKEVAELKQAVLRADLVLLSTPEYTHNIPAVVKNMIEWCTASGEFHEKRVLPITFTPHAPRGEFAMKSLQFSLQALNATLVAEWSIYQTEVEITDHQLILPEELKEMIITIINL